MRIPYTATKHLKIGCRVLGRALMAMFAHFCDVNPAIMADFKLPTWRMSLYTVLMSWRVSRSRTPCVTPNRDQWPHFIHKLPVKDLWHGTGFPAIRDMRHGCPSGLLSLFRATLLAFVHLCITGVVVYKSLLLKKYWWSPYLSWPPFPGTRET